MINLRDHIKRVEGKDYVPYDIALKAVQETFTYQRNIDSEMGKVEGYLKSITDTLSSTLENDKNSTRES
jgi:hypothetical protein